MKEFSLHLLGVPRVIKAGEVNTRFRSKRVLALLAYLVATRRNVPRAELVDLIWPDKEEKQGRANLRWALTTLAKTLEPEALERTRSAISFVLPPHCAIDLLSFDAALAENDIEKLANIVSQLGDSCEYMAGFYFDQSAEFETWLIVQRESWRKRIWDGLSTLVSHYYTHNQHRKALTFAQQWVAFDSWSEVAHRWVIELYARLGRFEAASAQFEVCRRILADELGTEPTIETLALFERVQQASQATLSKLPLQATRFIGRNKEVAQLSHMLLNPNIRLITISGPGGIGKTRLGLRCAENSRSSFMDGAIFVALDAIEHAKQIPQVIVNALVEDNVLQDVQGTMAPLSYLHEKLHNKELLLVLDNFEHVIGGIDTVLDIIHYAPRVKLIVTSRERLNIRWEHALELDGLPVQSAMTLFIQCAERVQSDFSLTSQNEPYITHICHLADGMPLAIELAASWVRYETCATIATQIQTNFDFLTSKQRDVPSRHQSVRAAFDYSWQLLSEDERLLLQKLSVFHDGFSAEAARELCGASLQALASLADKSLLQQPQVNRKEGTPSRYIMHRLLRQFSAELTNPVQYKAVYDDHATYYCNLLQKLNPQLQLGNQQALNTVYADLANIRAAWKWSVSEKQTNNIALGWEGLAYYFDMRCRWYEGFTVFEKTLRLVRSVSAENDHPMPLVMLLGSIQVTLANFYSRLHRHEDALELLRHALITLKPFQYAAGEQFIQFVMARTLTNSGQWHEAAALYKKTIALATANGDKRSIARCSVNLSHLLEYQGHFAQALVYSEKAETLFHDIGDQRGISVAYVSQASTQMVLGELDKAQQLLTKADEISMAIDDQLGIVHSYQQRGLIALFNSEFDEAEALLDSAERLAEILGETPLVGHVLVDQSHLELRRVAPDAALEHSRSAAKLADKTGSQLLKIRALNYQGLALCVQGRFVSAETTLASAIQLALPLDNIPQILLSFVGFAACYQATGKHQQSEQLASIARSHPAAMLVSKSLLDHFSLAPADHPITFEQALDLVTASA